MKKIAFLLLVAPILGCKAIDLPMRTQFEPSADGRSFRYVAKTGSLLNTPDSPDAERERLAWLGDYLSENKLCPAGYRISERKVVQNAGLAGPTIFYTGACN